MSRHLARSASSRSFHDLPDAGQASKQPAGV
jgi:hypothetical protein